VPTAGSGVDVSLCPYNQEDKMNKVGSALVVILLSAALASPAFGQNLTAGVKAGIDFADLGGDFEDLIETSTDLKTGFSIGGFLGFDLHRMFRLQGEVQYVQKGAKASEGDFELKFNVDYIEVLVPLTLMIPVEGAVAPRFYVGPSLAFEMSCKLKGELDGQSREFDCDSDEVGAPTNSTDFGVLFGGGIDIALGSGALTFDVLYNLGLGDIAKEDPTDPKVEVTNRNIQVLVGYGFRFGS
jgi:hypothetical protein